MYDARQRDTIRAGLIAYMKDHKAGTPRMQTLTRVPARTIHRFIKGDWVNDGAVQLIEEFLGRVPGKPLVLNALGEALAQFYAQAPDRIAGIYSVTIDDAPVSQLTIKFGSSARTYYLAKERTTGALLRSYEGIMVFTGKSVLAVLKDRLMRTARVHMLHLNPEDETFHGLVYDNGPLERGALPYQLEQTTLERLERIDYAE